ncbi:MAG: gamma-glutamylcyclotransferase family protein [Candidatus Actinomarinaceae bacterium]
MEINKVFVYGTLKKGYHNHNCLEGSEFIGSARSIEKFNMINLGGFPAVLYNSDDGYQIWGEIYKINDRILQRLDLLEGEGTFYNRVEEDFFMVGNKPTKNGRKFKCWLYVLKDMPYTYDYNNVYLNTKNLLTYERV